MQGLWIFLLTFISTTVDSANINKTAYYQMPPLFLLDSFDECLEDEYGHYCITNVEIVSNKSSTLYEYILEISSNRRKRFRRDVLHRGICVTKSCREFFKPNQEEDFIKNLSLVREVLEGCMNTSLEERYGFQGKVDIEYCNYKGQRRKVDSLHVAVAIIAVLIILCNIVGTFYARCTTNSLNSPGNAWLLAFSIQRNWNKLTSTKVKTQDAHKYDPRLDRLKFIQGMRFISMNAVVFSHATLLIAGNYVENPLFIEIAFDDPVNQLIFNGTLIMQTYFCISSFLTAYNFLLYIEKNRKFNLWIYPKGVMDRWLRLTPVYALVVAFVATWAPHMGHGALWDRVVTSEQAACRVGWWRNLLFINNYYNLDFWCLPQTWYLGAEVQLFCYSLAVMMLIWKFPNCVKFLFPFLVLMGILIPAITTYVGKYDATVIQTPEAYQTLYKYERTFQDVYQRGHTNTIGSTLGILAAYLVYFLQKRGVTLKDKMWFRICVYMAFPLGLGTIVTGMMFYQDNYVYDPIIAAIYSGLYKAIYSLALATLVVGFSFGVARPYGRVLDWSPFQVPGKLTFCALFVHPILQRSFLGIMTKPFFMSEYGVLHFLASSVAMTYILAVPLYVMVEMPAYTLQKLILNGKRTEAEPKPQSQFSSNITIGRDKDNTKL